MLPRDIWDSRFVRGTLVGALIVVLVLSFLFSKLSLFRRRAELAEPPPHRQNSLPSSKLLAGAFLNYRTLAADLIWSRALVYYGDRRSRGGHLDALEEYADTISDLDPYFYDVYRWFADIYLTHEFVRRDDAIEVANAFLERGMKYFPEACDLPHTAALNYIGYSPGASAERRLRESKRAIEYLERTARCPDAPENTAALLDYFTQREQRLRHQIAEAADAGVSDHGSNDEPGLTEAQRKFYVRLYLTDSRPSVRQRVISILRRHDAADSKLLEQAREYARQLEAQHRESYSYLPVDLWTLVDERSHDY